MDRLRNLREKTKKLELQIGTLVEENEKLLVEQEHCTCVWEVVDTPASKNAHPVSACTGTQVPTSALVPPKGD